MARLQSVGILGGGQLARMLIEAADRLAIDCHVMSAEPTDPAAQISKSWAQGDIASSAEILRFAEKVDLLTFESEFVAPQLLDELLAKKIACAPSATHMKAIQDRLYQKKLLEKYDVPTSLFYQIDRFEDLKTIEPEIKLPIVLKARLGGYDGKGTFILRDWDDASVTECKSYLEKCAHGAIAEHFVPFERELAISVARNKKGQSVFLPLVESFQEEYRCLWVKGPIEHDRLDPLKAKLKDLLDAEEYVGLISFELFETPEGLTINELAPRVHNSAHYSQNALRLDQFGYHLKAILNQDLPEPELLANGFAMYNLIGSKTSEPKWNLESEASLHWYGKKENRPGRKMGHLNAIDSSPKAALEKLINARKDFDL